MLACLPDADVQPSIGRDYREGVPVAYSACWLSAELAGDPLIDVTVPRGKGSEFRDRLRVALEDASRGRWGW